MAGASPAKIVDMTVLHQIGLQRFSTGVIHRIEGALRRVAQDIEAKIAADLPRGEKGSPSPSSLRLQTLLNQVAITQQEAHRAIRTDFEGEMVGLGAVEADFVNRLGKIAVGTDAALATVSADQMRAAVVSQPFQGKTLREWTTQFEAGDARRMREQIMIGYLEGESIPQMTRRLRTTSEITKRGAEALVRTSVTHINARAVAESANANPDLFQKYQWLSILDNRTTPICQHRAGLVYRHGKGPLPPAHVNCRSATYNLVAGVDAPDDIGYAEWLAKQSADDQRDVLGPSRFKLYQKGELSVDRFTDTTGRQLTLEELRARNTAAFEKAGL